MVTILTRKRDEVAPDSQISPYDIRQGFSRLDERIDDTRDDLDKRIDGVWSDTWKIIGGLLGIIAFFLGAIAVLFIIFAIDPINKHLESIDTLVGNIKENTIQKPEAVTQREMNKKLDKVICAINRQHGLKCDDPLP